MRDDGPGNGADSSESHQFGLRSLRERLTAAYGAATGLSIERSPQGFEARFIVPSRSEAQ